MPDKYSNNVLAALTSDWQTISDIADKTGLSALRVNFLIAGFIRVRAVEIKYQSGVWVGLQLRPYYRLAAKRANGQAAK